MLDIVGAVIIEQWSLNSIWAIEIFCYSDCWISFLVIVE